MYKNEMVKALLECYNQKIKEKEQEKLNKKFNLRQEFIECTKSTTYNEQTCHEIIKKILEWDLVEK